MTANDPNSAGYNKEQNLLFRPKQNLKRTIYMIENNVTMDGHNATARLTMNN